MSAHINRNSSAEHGRSSTWGSGRLEDIVDAALTLFAEQGYLGTSMKDIAAALGLRAPSLYNHVESKQDLLREIMYRGANELLSSHRAAIATTNDVVEQLRRAMETHVTHHAVNPREVRVGNAEIQNLEEPDRSEVESLRQQYSTAWTELIERGVAEGRFDSPSPRLSSLAMLEIGIGVSRWYRPDGPLTVAQIAYYYGDMALRMVDATAAGVRRPHSGVSDAVQLSS